NGYAEFSPVATQHAAGLEGRAAGYGVGYVAVDGNDVVATAEAMDAVVDGVRGGDGPVLVEATTYRWHGHYEGDPERYRSPEGVRRGGGGAPRPARGRRGGGGGVSDDGLGARGGGVGGGLAAGGGAAGGFAPPAPAALFDFVVRPRPAVPEPAPPPAGAPVFR